MKRHGLTRCDRCQRLWNRDVNGALNIWKIAHGALVGRPRPGYLSRAGAGAGAEAGAGAGAGATARGVMIKNNFIYHTRGYDTVHPKVLLTPNNNNNNIHIHHHTVHINRER